MWVTHERNGDTGLAVLACRGCSSFLELGLEVTDDRRTDTFILDHRGCRVTADAPD